MPTIRLFAAAASTAICLRDAVGMSIDAVTICVSICMPIHAVCRVVCSISISIDTQLAKRLDGMAGLDVRLGRHVQTRIPLLVSIAFTLSLLLFLNLFHAHC
jgi:hypothetical protein